MIFATMYGAVTFVLIVGFIGLCLWAYSPKQRKQFSQHANIPFIEEASCLDVSRRNV